MGEDKPDRGFTIIDRRGSSHEDASPAEGEEGARVAPRVDFATFVLSLATSGLYHMGLVRDPEGGKPASEPDLVLARQTIDTLEMLEAKTGGNLDAEEAKLLTSLLYELRVHFVEANKRKTEPAPADEGDR